MIVLETYKVITDLEFLSKMASSAIYGLKDEESKTIWIGRTSNFIRTLGTLVTDLRDNNHACSGKKVELVLLDVEVCTPVRQAVIAKQFLDKGYTILNKRSPIDLRVVVKDFRIGSASYIKVSLISKRNDETIVGIFDDHEEAITFRDKYYSNGVESVVYSSNSLTDVFRGIG